MGTIKDVIDDMRDQGESIGAVSICSFRPFPTRQLHDALCNAERIVVLEKALSLGIGGVVSHDLHMALAGTKVRAYTVVAGLGGRPITKTSLRGLFTKAQQDALEPLTFLDLNQNVVNREIEREKQQRRSGPTAENILRDIAAGNAR